ERYIQNLALAHPAVNADDVMTAELRNPRPDPPFAEYLLKIALDDRADQGGKNIKRRADPGKDKADRVDATNVVERSSFAIANGGDRNHRHIEGIEKRPAFDDDVTASPKGGNQEESEDSECDARKTGCEKVQMSVS